MGIVAWSGFAAGKLIYKRASTRLFFVLIGKQINLLERKKLYMYWGRLLVLRNKYRSNSGEILSTK